MRPIGFHYLFQQMKPLSAHVQYTGLHFYDIDFDVQNGQYFQQFLRCKVSTQNRMHKAGFNRIVRVVQNAIKWSGVAYWTAHAVPNKSLCVRIYQLSIDTSHQWRDGKPLFFNISFLTRVVFYMIFVEFFFSQ